MRAWYGGKSYEVVKREPDIITLREENDGTWECECPSHIFTLSPKDVVLVEEEIK